MDNSRTYITKPSPGYDAFGRCLSCGFHSTSTIGHQCLVPVDEIPWKRTFVVTVEEVDYKPGALTSTHPSYGITYS
jgi:hypothetical protein